MGPGDGLGRTLLQSKAGNHPNLAWCMKPLNISAPQFLICKMGIVPTSQGKLIESSLDKPWHKVGLNKLQWVEFRQYWWCYKIWQVLPNFFPSQNILPFQPLKRTKKSNYFYSSFPKFIERHDDWSIIPIKVQEQGFGGSGWQIPELCSPCWRAGELLDHLYDFAFSAEVHVSFKWV